MNITILGAGAGGTTVAFDCAAHGHQVSLFDFPQFPGNGNAPGLHVGEQLRLGLSKGAGVSWHHRTAAT